MFILIVGLQTHDDYRTSNASSSIISFCALSLSIVKSLAFNSSSSLCSSYLFYSGISKLSFDDSVDRGDNVSVLDYA